MYIYLYNQHGQKCSHPQNQNIEVYEVRKKYVLKLLYRYYIICCCSRFLFYSAVFLLLLYTRNCRIQTGTIIIFSEDSHLLLLFLDLLLVL